VVQCGVVCDAIQPGGKTRAALEAVERTKRTDERVLRRFLRVFGTPYDSQGETVDLRTIPLKEYGIAMVLSAQYAFNNLIVRFLHTFLSACNGLDSRTGDRVSRKNLKP